MRLQGLYAITGAELVADETLMHEVRKAILGGAKIVQLREKKRTDSELINTAQKLCTLCKDMGAVFIINDRIELAQKVEAHGIHIGKDDIDLFTARRMLPNGIIGVSCYNSLETAIEMERKGADYVAFGSFFLSPTKPQAVHVPLSLLRAAKTRLTIPVCSIGGITPENAEQLVEAGADMLAVISSLWQAPDIRRQAERFACLFRRQ